MISYFTLAINGHSGFRLFRTPPHSSLSKGGEAMASKPEVVGRIARALTVCRMYPTNIQARHTARTCNRPLMIHPFNP
jgi:hypothetical protein